MNEHETIADIRVETEAEFRKLIDLWITQTKSTAIEPCERLHAMQKFNNYFDRLEAAHRRERGDCAKLREALVNLVDVIDRCDSGSPLWWHSGAKGVMPLKNAKAALAVTEQKGGNDGH